jgi:hypothetical protein
MILRERYKGRRFLWVVFFSTFCAQPAAAYHCPLGQIYRTHLHVCVGSSSKLGRAYAYAIFSHTHINRDIRRINVGDHKIETEGTLLGSPMGKEPTDKTFSVEIIKSPDDIDRDRAIEILKGLMK